MIIDFHTHVFPDKISASALTSLAESSLLTPALEGNTRSILGSMASDKIDYSVVLPVATNTRQVPNLNLFAAELQGKYPNILAFGAIHPDFEDIETELKKAKDFGLRGIKIHPDYVGHFVDDDAMVRCINACSALDLPVLLHAGFDKSFPELPRCTPDRVYKLLRKINPAKLILAHVGGYLCYNEFKKWLLDEDIYIDTSVGIGWGYKGFENEINDIIRTFPSERILFGTDSPWDNPSDCLKILKSIGISDDAFENITHKNAEKLLKINL